MEKAIKKFSPIFVIPTLASFIIGFIVPFFEGIYLSFCKFMTIKNAEWVGIKNYQYAISDSSFWHSFVFTVLYAVVSILVINIIGLGLALLLTKGLKGTNIFRTIFFMPNLIGG
ncbi:MAG: sugar ABC transporter permease, partial [Eubacterium sp.]|nr:sugar ABC transporter permease [Eubacterium sp.]